MSVAGHGGSKSFHHRHNHKVGRKSHPNFVLVFWHHASQKYSSLNDFLTCLDLDRIQERKVNGNEWRLLNK